MSAVRYADAARTLAGVSSLMLGWRPDEFWRATPDELAAAMGSNATPGGAPMDGDTLATLRARFPDGMETG